MTTSDKIEYKIGTTIRTYVTASTNAPNCRGAVGADVAQMEHETVDDFAN